MEHLKPLVLRDVAEDIEMHESTVSRVTTNKYMHTPLGIFELKYFFSTAIQQYDGEALAAESIRQRIKAMIKNENAEKPLTDNAISKIHTRNFTRECPFCAEIIKKRAKVCKHCGKEVAGQ